MWHSGRLAVLALLFTHAKLLEWARGGFACLKPRSKDIVKGISYGPGT